MDPSITSPDPDVRTKLFRMRYIKAAHDFPLSVVSMDFRFKAEFVITRGGTPIYHKNFNHEVPALDLAYPARLNPLTDTQYATHETYISHFVENVTEFPGEAPPIQSLLFLLKDILLSINPSSAQYAGRCSSHKNKKDTHRFLQMYGVYLRILKEVSQSQDSVLETFKEFIRLFTMTTMASLLMDHPYAEARTKVAALTPTAIGIVEEFTEADIPSLIDITTAFTAYLDENYSLIRQFEAQVGKGMLAPSYLETYAEKTQVHMAISHCRELDGDLHMDISRMCLQTFVGIGDSLDDDALNTPMEYDTTHLKALTTTFNKETINTDMRENNLYQPNGLTGRGTHTPHANIIMSRLYVIACNQISKLCLESAQEGALQIQSFAISRLVVYLLYLFDKKRKCQVCFPYAVQAKIANVAMKNASESPHTNKPRSRKSSHAKATKHRKPRRKTRGKTRKKTRKKSTLVRKTQRRLRKTYRRTKRRVRKLLGLGHANRMT